MTHTNDKMNCVIEEHQLYSSHKDFTIKTLLNTLDSMESVLRWNSYCKEKIEKEIDNMRNLVNNLITN